MNSKIPVITIDGPSGVGKSTISKIIAKKLHFHLLESGKIYRLIACSALKQNISIDEKHIISIIKNLDIFSNEYDEKLIQYEKISTLSSQLASFPKVRKILLNKQRLFLQSPGLIAEGRDMGTVVFPNANLKFFLHACLKLRTKRRMLELKKNGFHVSFKKLFINMKNRDKFDENRLISPLCVPKNAIELDSTNMNIQEVIKIILDHIKIKI